MSTTQIDNNLRILYLTATSTAEAGNRVLLAWMKWLRLNNFFVALAYPGGGSIETYLNRWPDVPVLSLSFNFPSLRQCAKIIVDVLRLSQFIYKNNIKLIHCNAESAYYVGMLASRMTSTPIITHFRFHFPEQFYSWMFKGKRRPDGVLFVSNALYHEEIQKLVKVTPTARTMAVHNCLDMEQLCQYQNKIKQLVESQTRITVVYPAAIQELKNQLHLFAIDELLRKRNIDVQILSAGRSKEDDYWEQCKQLAIKFDESRVTFLGHVDDIPSLYANSALSISLSQYETFGMSALESMAAGIPVVYYDVPALKEVIGDAGVAVPMGDIVAMASAIENLLKNEEFRSSKGKTASQRAKDFFSPEAVMPKLLDFYHQIVS